MLGGIYQFCLQLFVTLASWGTENRAQIDRWPETQTDRARRVGRRACSVHRIGEFLVPIWVVRQMNSVNSVNSWSQSGCEGSFRPARLDTLCADTSAFLAIIISNGIYLLLRCARIRLKFCVQWPIMTPILLVFTKAPLVYKQN
jgi:hypothetical protein